MPPVPGARAPALAHTHTHTHTHRGTQAYLKLAELCSNRHSITVPIANRNWRLESEQHLAGMHDALAAAGGVQQYGAEHVAALAGGGGGMCERSVGDKQWRRGTL